MALSPFEDIAPKNLWNVAAELGEGPVWLAQAGQVWFVDIKGHAVHCYDPATGDRRSFAAPAAPGFLAPVSGGGFVAGLKTGLHHFDPQTGDFRLISVVEPAFPGNRLNDGAVDARGRLWFGSMHDHEADATGKLYCHDGQALQAVDDGYVITNGPAFSPDGRTLYHTDTLKKVIYAFDLDPDGAVKNRRVFVEIEDDAGYPDGPVVDSEGYLWTGLFAGWGVRRYAPDGVLAGVVRLPCANVTKIAFGGPDLRDVYVTTAWKGLSADQRAQQPLAGALFHFRSPVAGQPQALLPSSVLS